MTCTYNIYLYVSYSKVYNAYIADITPEVRTSVKEETARDKTKKEKFICVKIENKMLDVTEKDIE